MGTATSPATTSPPPRSRCGWSPAAPRPAARTPPARPCPPAPRPRRACSTPPARTGCCPRCPCTSTPPRAGCSSTPPPASPSAGSSPGPRRSAASPRPRRRPPPRIRARPRRRCSPSAPPRTARSPRPPSMRGSSCGSPIPRRQARGRCGWIRAGCWPRGRRPAPTCPARSSPPGPERRGAPRAGRASRRPPRSPPGSGSTAPRWSSPTRPGSCWATTPPRARTCGPFR